MNIKTHYNAEVLLSKVFNEKMRLLHSPNTMDWILRFDKWVDDKRPRIERLMDENWEKNR